MTMKEFPGERGTPYGGSLGVKLADHVATQEAAVNTYKPLQDRPDGELNRVHARLEQIEKISYITRNRLESFINRVMGPLPPNAEKTQEDEGPAMVHRLYGRIETIDRNNRAIDSLLEILEQL